MDTAAEQDLTTRGTPRIRKRKGAAVPRLDRDGRQALNVCLYFNPADLEDVRDVARMNNRNVSQQVRHWLDLGVRQAAATLKAYRERQAGE
jgi:hypothetical protein